jgi:ferredoxin
MPWFAGVTRPEIDWGPAIDPKKCVSCGLCLNCGKDVFDWVDG